MRKSEVSDARRRIAESAFDFLERAVEEIEKHPKYAIINFSTAIELLIKFRLMSEHWSLLVEKISEAELGKFLNGTCRTVSQNDAIARLKKVCGEVIPEDAVKQFGKISEHRNRMIHFFHEVSASKTDPKVVEEVVKELCSCWYYLDRLFVQWDNEFRPFQQKIRKMRYSMLQVRQYLAVSFERISPDILTLNKNGVRILKCSACGFEAAAVVPHSKVFLEQKCLVCELTDAFASIDCPSGCGAKVHIAADYDRKRTCAQCEHEVTSAEFADALSTHYVDPADDVKINCALCSSMCSVVLSGSYYVCTECLGYSKHVEHCEWCNEMQMGGGKLEASYYTGCEFCEGQAGWIRDE